MKTTKIKAILFLFLLLGVFCFPSFSNAEMEIEIQEGEITYSLSPKNPEPYGDVTIDLSSYATDLTKAYFTWKINNKTVSYGTGKTSYTTKAGGPDTAIMINVDITPAGSSSSISKKIAIFTSEIEVMWESVNGYTPPFYKGKSLPTKGSTMKIVAIPNTKTVRSGIGSISYTWKRADSVVSSASGYNKNYYMFNDSMFEDDNNITVIASSVSGNYSAEKTITVPTYNPKIVFYKRSLADGILYNYALNNETNMKESEMTILAEPYFMTTKDTPDEFNYKWQINGNIVDTPEKNNEMTVRPASRGGYATISLTIKNLSKLFQEATNKLKINL